MTAQRRWENCRAYMFDRVVFVLLLSYRRDVVCALLVKYLPWCPGTANSSANGKVDESHGVQVRHTALMSNLQVKIESRK